MDETTARIPLSCTKTGPGAIQRYTLVDMSDEAWVRARGRWYMNNWGYAVLDERVDGVKRNVRLHRLILGLPFGDKREGDHINHDRLDNRRVNLRVVTLAENRQNRLARGGSSQYRGVSWKAHNRKWVAQGSVGGQHYYLGVFDDELEAAEIARQWRHEHMPGSLN